MKNRKGYVMAGMIFSSAFLLAACGGDGAETSSVATSGGNTAAGNAEVNKEGFPIVDEPIEMTMIAPGTGMAEWEDMPTLTEYAKKTNINFEYTTPPLSDFSTRFNLTFASGELPDVIYAPGSDVLTPALEVDYGSQGLLVPLNDLIEEYGPNISKVLEEKPEIRQSITSTDGNIYTLPRINGGATSTWIRGPVWINGEWMEALGIEDVPKTTDELYDMLVRFKNEDPNGNGQADEIPLTDVKMDSTRPWLLSAFGIKEWGIEEHDGEVRYAPMTENYRGYLEFMHKLYEEGLLDKEVFSQADEQKKAKGENDKLGMFPDWFSFFTTGQTEEEAIINPMMGPMTSEYSEEAIFPMSTGIQRGAFAITKENPNPAAAMRWVDYFYSKEGHDYLNRGPAGYLWEWVDEEGGERQFREDLEATNREEYRGQITPDYGIVTPVNTDHELDPIGDEGISDFEIFLQEESDAKVNKYGEVAYPLVYLTPEEQEVVSGVEVDLQTYVRNSEAQFITGQLELNDENWEEYVSTIEKIGVEDYVEVYQSAYDRWLESAE
ncbi:Lipoprotein LipO [Jeotgalibaca dankookensis]|uniref:Lipoprotein LipO n=1 Tax=Jeotgalibaca dankookensis TaxID=708126 RepID=A0A1S6IR79_9LACT|nr:extracellular solute-binding protein [Jeotgalibaca dankookensis]AQS53990.1 Lipoprotein LipO [Jeotgalibaca dankookensis]